MNECFRCETELEPEYKFCPECGERLFRRTRLAARCKENRGEIYMSGERVYGIGDRGPAKGWIFYDKGAQSDGWQYLEAAPEEAAISAVWGDMNFIFGNLIEGRTDGFGAGAENTAKIIDKLKEAGKEKAAHFLKNHSISGFTDWYIPSCEEVLAILDNLNLKYVGGIKNYYGDYVVSSKERIIECGGGPPDGIYVRCYNKIHWVRRF